MSDEHADKYWICDKCAKEKKWEAPTWPVTVIHGRCGYCKPEEITYLIPIVDFKRPGKVQVWD